MAPEERYTVYVVKVYKLSIRNHCSGVIVIAKPSSTAYESSQSTNRRCLAQWQANSTPQQQLQLYRHLHANINAEKTINLR